MEEKSDLIIVRAEALAGMIWHLKMLGDFSAHFAIIWVTSMGFPHPGHIRHIRICQATIHLARSIEVTDTNWQASYWPIVWDQIQRSF
jgi:hypothetical protein